MATTLRLGNTTSDNYSTEALEFSVKMSKCTSVARPKTWKKYALRTDETGPDAMAVDSYEGFYAPLKSRTEYYVDHNAADKDMEGDDDDDELPEEPTAEYVWKGLVLRLPITDNISEPQDESLTMWSSTLVTMMADRIALATMP